MTVEQLTVLYQNPFHVQAMEFFLKESTILSEMLERMNWNPSTGEQRHAIKRQCERLDETRLVLQQCWELVLSERDKSSRRESSPSPLSR